MIINRLDGEEKTMYMKFDYCARISIIKQSPIQILLVATKQNIVPNSLKGNEGTC